MTLRDLARNQGKKLKDLGLHPVHASQINIGRQRAGAFALQKISEALGLPIPVVAAACDAAWNAKRALPAPDASAVGPGALVSHGANQPITGDVV